jgi:hypothetical protein
MSVQQYFTASLSVFGDGVSTQQIVNLDTYGHVTASGYNLCQLPTITVGTTTYTGTGYIVGNILVITWSAPFPPGPQGGGTMTIAY